MHIRQLCWVNTRRLFQQMPKFKILQQNFSFSWRVLLHLDTLFASSQEIILNILLHNLDLSLTLHPSKNSNYKVIIKNSVLYLSSGLVRVPIILDRGRVKLLPLQLKVHFKS